MLGDAELYPLLLRFDEDLARSTRARGCGRCGGRLDRADYPRKPRGIPQEFMAAHTQRLSFCCAVEGCRRRATPPSVRFLGRRVYVGAAMVSITALDAGAQRAEVRQLSTWLGLSARTLARWRRWWRAVFAESPFWRSACGLLRTPVSTTALPCGLLQRFAGDLRARLIAGLRFLAPTTTSAGVM